MAEKIYILLPVHNRRTVTEQFIQCLKRQTYTCYHLTLIDDGSSDGTSEMVIAYYSNATILRGDGNLWWAGSLQQGFNWLKSGAFSPDTIVLIMNDDTYFDPDFLERAVDLLRNRSRTLLAPVCHYSKTNQIQNAGIHIDWRRLSFEQARTQGEINCLTTRALFLRLSDFLEIGGFYPKILPHYFSDYEFTIRAHSKGMTLRTDPSLKLTINEDTTGYSRFEDDTFWQFQKKLFSKKSILNPATWILFVLLACPFPWKLTNLLRIVSGQLKLQLKQMKISMKRTFGRSTGMIR